MQPISDSFAHIAVVHNEYYAEIRKAYDDESRRRGIPWVGPGGQSRMMMMIIFWCYRTN